MTIEWLRHDDTEVSCSRRYIRGKASSVHVIGVRCQDEWYGPRERKKEVKPFYFAGLPQPVADSLDQRRRAVLNGELGTVMKGKPLVRLDALQPHSIIIAETMCPERLKALLWETERSS